MFIIIFSSYNQTFFYSSVNSQNIVIDTDDTSNGFSDPISGEYIPSESENRSITHSAFVNLAKELEAKRMENLSQADRMFLSNSEMDAVENEFSTDRWMLGMQVKDEISTNNRLTAPRSELRKRKPIPKPKSKAVGNSQKVDQLRAKQIELVDEQFYLQKILQENATIAQEEAQERLNLSKVQCQIAEINAQEAQERLKLLKIQCQIAELDLQKKQMEQQE